MRVLLTNDDGIHAPGIEALYNALVDLDGTHGGPFAETVWPVAPLEVQSATSHGVTFKTPLMVSKEVVSPTMSGLAVDGRPADCVKLAICSLWPEKFGVGQRPDLVISGMNAGTNVGINVIYSGTVAAAIEAAFLGVPSIAVSLHLGKGTPRFDVAARHARRTLDLLVKGGIVGAAPGCVLQPHGCVSVNIPICQVEPLDPPTPERPKMTVCPMNTHGLVDAYERRVSPGGDVYYWAAGSGLDFRTADAGTDVPHLLKREITITPLKYDLTDHGMIEAWANALKSD
jgi:5'-nucleotidase